MEPDIYSRKSTSINTPGGNGEKLVRAAIMSAGNQLWEKWKWSALNRLTTHLHLQMPGIIPWGAKSVTHFPSSFCLQWFNLITPRLQNASNPLDRILPRPDSSHQPNSGVALPGVTLCVRTDLLHLALCPWEGGGVVGVGGEWGKKRKKKRKKKAACSSNHKSIRYRSLLCVCVYQSHMAICGPVLHNMNTGEGVKWSVAERSHMFISPEGMKGMCGCSGHAPDQHSQKVINLDGNGIYCFLFLLLFFFFGRISEQMNAWSIRGSIGAIMEHDLCIVHSVFLLRALTILQHFVFTILGWWLLISTASKSIFLPTIWRRRAKAQTCWCTLSRSWREILYIVAVFWRTGRVPSGVCTKQDMTCT